MTDDSDAEEPSGLIVPVSALQPDTLRALIEEYVSREGTDYGSATYSLDEKVQHVMNQLSRGEAEISFDSVSGTINIAPRNRR